MLASSSSAVANSSHFIAPHDASHVPHAGHGGAVIGDTQVAAASDHFDEMRLSSSPLLPLPSPLMLPQRANSVPPDWPMAGRERSITPPPPVPAATLADLRAIASARLRRHKDFFISQTEKILDYQRNLQFVLAQELCRWMLRDAAEVQFDIHDLFTQSNFNLPAYCIMFEDFETLHVLRDAGVLENRDNHMFHLYYLWASESVQQLQLNYFDLEISPHLRAATLFTESYPLHVEPYLRCLVSKRSASTLAYFCQSRRFAAHCATLAGSLHMAQQAMLLPTVLGREILEDHDSGNSWDNESCASQTAVDSEPGDFAATPQDASVRT